MQYLDSPKSRQRLSNYRHHEAPNLLCRRGLEGLRGVVRESKGRRPGREVAGAMGEARDLVALQKVHDQQPPRDQAGHAARHRERPPQPLRSCTPQECQQRRCMGQLMHCLTVLCQLPQACLVLPACRGVCNPKQAAQRGEWHIKQHARAGCPRQHP